MTVRQVKAVSDIGTILTSAELVEGDAPSTGFKKLIGIRSTPAKGEAPDTLDATELDDEKNISIAGRVTVPALEYTFNYTAGNVAKLSPLANKRMAFLEVLPEGNGHLIIGTMTYWSNGVGLNSVHEGTLAIIAEDIQEVEDAEAMVSE